MVLMTVIQSVFERKENKYILTREEFDLIEHRLKEFMQEDRYGLYTILSIYFDTESDEIIRRSLEKPAYKEKLRLRSYGVPGPDDTVFLELKKKFKGIVYKRRTSMKLEAAERYVRDHEDKPKDDQIMKEIDWFVERYDPVPKVCVAYDRTALFAMEDSSLRITFDFNVRCRNYDIDLSLGDHGDPLLDPGQCIMEVKALGAMPMWLCDILSDLDIYPATFSKYGTYYRNKLMTGGRPLV